MSQKVKWFWATFLIFLALDQATKMWVYTNLEYRVDEVVLIPGFLSIVHAQNPGAAFGILVDYEYRHLVFLAFTIGAMFVIFDMYRKLPSGERLLSVALGLIMSGAVGNAIDRVHKKTVTDFIRVFVDAPDSKAWLIKTFGTNEWPSFNVADSALLIGVLAFFLHSMFVEGSDVEEPSADKTGPDTDPQVPPAERVAPDPNAGV